MMPPKRKKPAKSRMPPLIDGRTTEEMSKEELEELIMRLRKDLERKEKDRNYFKLDRDKIHTFWGITERQLEEPKADCKNLDKEIEDDEGRHQVEIKVYKQKMKRFLCEHQNTISEVKADGLTSTDPVQKEHAQLENELHERMGGIRVDMQELNIENLVKELELKNDEEMTKPRNSWEVKLTEISAKSKKKLELCQQELENMRRNVISEKKDFWNSHFTSLTGPHNNLFSDLNTRGKKEGFLTNRSLKKQVKGMKVKHTGQDLTGLLQDIKCFSDVLSHGEKETELKEKRKYSIEKKCPNLKVKAKELADGKRDCEVLEQKFSELHLERDELYKTFTQNVQKTQHNADLKSMRLSKRLEAVTDSVDKMQAQLSSVLSASNMDQTALDGVTNNTEEDIDSIKYSIKNFQCIKAKISKARKDP